MGELYKYGVKIYIYLLFFVQKQSSPKISWTLKVEEWVKMHFNVAKRAERCSKSAPEPRIQWERTFPPLAMLPSRDPACRAADKTAAGRREKVGVASPHHRPEQKHEQKMEEQ